MNKNYVAKELRKKGYDVDNGKDTFGVRDTAVSPIYAVIHPEQYKNMKECLVAVDSAVAGSAKMWAETLEKAIEQS